jgi:hypothetical protein
MSAATATVVVTTRPGRPAGPRRALVRARDLVPAGLVVALAVLGPQLTRNECASTDGPQFRCWLERQA